jgi:polysaccharide biosynthesis PFTS motif protein
MVYNYINRSRRIRLRSAIRGYNILNKSLNLSLINQIREKLAETTVSLSSNSVIVNKGLIDKEIITQNFQQYLVLNILTVEFNEKLLSAISNKNKSIIHPLPYEWRVELESFGFIADNYLNKIKYKLFFLKFLLKGLYELFFIVIRSICNSSSRKNDLSNSVYFHNLSSKNFPVSNSKENHDIISWYIKKYSLKKSSQAGFNVYVNFKKNDYKDDPLIKYIESPVLIKTDLRSFSFFIYLSCISLIESFISLFSRDGHRIILTFQIIRFLRIYFSNHNAFPQKVLFNNSDYIYRPLWSHGFDLKKTEVILYFYSTNSETFKSEYGYVKQQNFWHLCNWDTYYVWDDYQSDFIKRNIKYSYKIEIVGIIDFQNSLIPLELENNKSTRVAVFDVQPTRSSWYQMLGIDFEYYVPKNANSFNNDIFDVLSSYDTIIYCKGKRHIGSLADKSYQKNLSTWDNKNKIILLNPDISARELIEKCDVVISMPFSTPSVIAKLLGVSSYYYDPTGLIQLDDRASHGIQIISGKNNLIKAMEIKLISNEK